MTDNRIGFIGLGVMGGHMAGHLAAAGKSLTVFDLNPAAVERLQGRFPDTIAAVSPAAVAEASDVVITMLPSGREVRDVVTGESGLLAGFAPGSLLIDTSSAAPWDTREIGEALTKKMVAMVDAPVSGAEAGARAADLVFMIGGHHADVARAQPLLALMGSRRFHLGPPASGTVMKAMNNLITAVIQTATTEALLAGTKAGLDPAVMNDVLDVSTGSSWVSRTHYRQRVFNRAFDDSFTFDLMLKDMIIATDIARKIAVGMPISEEAVRLWNDLRAELPLNSPISRLSFALERRADVELRPHADEQGRVPS